MIPVESSTTVYVLLVLVLRPAVPGIVLYSYSDTDIAVEPQFTAGYN